MIDYVFYSTSNSDYQNWQRDLLEYSFVKVNQIGKLICYCSENEDNNLPKTIHKSKIELVTNCHNYMNSISFPEKWGIANKLFSIKLWLEKNPDLNGSVLFLDPDMIFLESINITVERGTVVGQLWQDRGIESHPNFVKYTPKNFLPKLKRENIFMFPFAINIEDLRKIIDDFIYYSVQIYLKEKCWEADMYGLVISALKIGLKIIPRDFGCCNSWHEHYHRPHNMVHFPNIMYNKNNNKIWFKQDFTQNTLKIPWTLNIAPNSTTNRIEYGLISTIQEYINLQKMSKKYPCIFYWNNLDLNDTLRNYQPMDKYIILRPWDGDGGFNNIRMSFEIASVIAYRLNRILVVPDKYRINLLENQNDLSTFFEFTDIGIKTITMNEFCKKSNINNNWDEVKKISKVYDFDICQSYINLTNDCNIPENFKKKRNEIKIPNDVQNIFFDKNLLGNFYTCIYDSNMSQIKKFVCKHLHYKESIFAQAYYIIENLINQYQNYYSMHLRRNDFTFQYKDVLISDQELFQNISEIVPKGSTLYISTDIKEKSELGILNSEYNVIVFSDVKYLLDKYLNVDLYGLIEQIVCSRSKKFIGTKNSTFSNYIYRIRGYMKDITDTNYYINTKRHSNPLNKINNNNLNTMMNTKMNDIEWVQKWQGNHNIWSRDFRDVFNFKENLDTIFVSIASYRDQELVPTINNLLAKAAFPQRVFIGICLQDTEESINSFEFRNHPQIRIFNLNYQNAKGVCYARYLIQQYLIQDEKYFLQIDSHSRFAPNWDQNLINDLESCPSNKPILSTYPNGYSLNDKDEEYLKNKSLSPHIYTVFLGDSLRTKSNGEKHEELVLNNWIAAGFIFTYSEWCREVKYPINTNFNGEEDYLFIKSFIEDYDIYCPPECNVFHCYVNNFKESKEKYRPLVWNDIRLNNNNEELSKLIEEMDSGKYEEFKNKFGVCYRTRKILDKNYEKYHSTSKNLKFKDITIYEDKLNIFLWGISNDESQVKEGCKFSLATAEKFGLRPQLLGIGYDYSFMKDLSWHIPLSRFYLIRHVTSKINDNKILVFMDGFDTLFNGTEKDIVDKFLSFKTNILISAEKNFTYQWPNYKDKFEKIKSLYKYVNAGTIIGYSKELGNLAQSCINFLENSKGTDRGNDQGILGKYVYENLDNGQIIKLDTQCELFWVTTGDNKLLDKNLIFNENTKTYPLILHVVAGRREHFSTYEKVYNYIKNKK